MNQIIITGRLVKDPELKTTNSGTEVCNYTVAVDRRRRDKNDEKQTDYFDCTIWGKGGVFVNSYFHKGDGITIHGRMESRKYEKDGQKRVAWAVTVEDVEFPLGKGKGGSDNSSSGFQDLPESGGELPF